MLDHAPVRAYFLTLNSFETHLGWRLFETWAYSRCAINQAFRYNIVHLFVVSINT